MYLVSVIALLFAMASDILDRRTGHRPGCRESRDWQGRDPQWVGGCMWWQHLPSGSDLNIIPFLQSIPIDSQQGLQLHGALPHFSHASGVGHRPHLRRASGWATGQGPPDPQPFVMLLCARDGGHFRDFINDQAYLHQVLVPAPYQGDISRRRAA